MLLKHSLYGKTILSLQSNGRGSNTASTLTKSWKNGWFLSGQASSKESGDFNAPKYNLTNTGMNSMGFNLNGGYKTFKKGFTINYSYLDKTIGILRAAHIGNINDLVRAINNKQPVVIKDFNYNINAPKQEVTHQVFMYNMIFKITKGLNMMLEEGATISLL